MTVFFVCLLLFDRD